MIRVKKIYFITGIICTFMVIFIVLITGIEFVIYGNKDYFENEYTKYNVAKTVGMEINDLMYVTDEMMDYLKDTRDNLDITTTINGETREFFNSREKSHMIDVKDLFLKAMDMRKCAYIILILAIGFLIIIKSDYKYIIARTFQIGSVIFAILSLILGAIISTDFTKYFTIFHEMFFDNDLWILDPATDLLVNIVPEPFFIDTAFFIGVVFVLVISLIFIICTIYIRIRKKVGTQ